MIALKDAARLPLLRPARPDSKTDQLRQESAKSRAGFRGGSAAGVDRNPQNLYRKGMEVPFTPEQLQRLSQIAAHSGTDTAHLVKNAALRLVEEDAEFRAAVQEGIAQADRGELIDHDEVVARIERRFHA